MRIASRPQGVAEKIGTMESFSGNDVLKVLKVLAHGSVSLKSKKKSKYCPERASDPNGLTREYYAPGSNPEYLW